MTAMLADPSAELTPDERAAIDRLLSVALRDTGQSRRCADFLLSWWNTESCGGWDPTDLWSLDQELVDAVLVVVRLVGRLRYYPDKLGYNEAFLALVANWRPHLMDEDDQDG